MTVPESVYEPEAVEVKPGHDERVQTVSVFHMDPEPDGQGRMFVPDRAVLRYFRTIGEPWQALVTLSGLRLLSTGVVSSRSRADRTYWMPEEAAGYPSRREIPAFLLPTVEHYRPGGDW